MIRFAFLASRSLFVTSVLGFASVAVAGPTNVPFSASFATQEQIGFDPIACQASPYLLGTTTGSGQASHLGQTTGSATDCFAPTSPSTFAFSNGKLVLTAANGDQITIIYQGTLRPSATPPIFVIDGTYQIQTGTGRFGTVSGAGTLSGTENLETRQGQLKLNGLISY